jgi:deazaflavin-dependent oxidoreductase (nitroreductase family)
VTLRHALNSVIVAIFALAFMRAPWLVDRANPLVRRLLRTRLPMGPNTLLTVRGRTSGEPRSVPVSVWDKGDRQFVQSGYDETAWVRNLRAAGEAVVRRGDKANRMVARELPPEDAGTLIRNALAGHRPSRLGRAVFELCPSAARPSR